MTEPPRSNGEVTSTLVVYDTEEWPAGCSDEPFPDTERSAVMQVVVAEPAPTEFWQARGSFDVSFQVVPAPSEAARVLDPFTGGEDCTWVSEPLGPAEAGPTRDGGMVTWGVGPLVESTSYTADYFVPFYPRVTWVPPEYDFTYATQPTFDQSDVGGLYGQRVEVWWEGSDEVPAGSIRDGVWVPRPIGLVAPTTSVGRLEDLALTWTETGGQRLQLSTSWAAEGELHELTCYLIDDGAWSMPEEVVAELPDLDAWRLTLARSVRCPRETPAGSVWAEASVLVAFTLVAP